MRYVRRISLMAIIALLPLLFAATESYAGKSSNSRVDWDGSVQMPAIQRLPTYRLMNPAITRDGFDSLVEKLMRAVFKRTDIDLQAEFIGYSEGSYVWIDKSDPSSEIMQDASNGNIYLTNRMTHYVTLESVDLPSEENAVSVARKALEETGLLPGDFDATANLLRVGALASYGQTAAGEQPVTKMLRTVNWGRALDGVEVGGPGSKVVIQLGDKGDVVNIQIKWQDLEKLNPSSGGDEFLASDDAKAAIIDALENDWRSATSIVVNDVQLTYYDRSGKYIQPAYAVQTKIEWGPKTLDFLYYFSALKKPPEVIYTETVGFSPD